MRIGWGGEGFVEPRHQIAVGEEIHAKQRDEIGQAPAETGRQLQIPQERNQDQYRPNLRLDRVGRGADEGLDLQVLLERLEEQFAPAILVGRSDGTGPRTVMIDDEDENAAGVFTSRFDPTQQRLAWVLNPSEIGAPDRAESFPSINHNNPAN